MTGIKVNAGAATTVAFLVGFASGCYRPVEQRDLDTLAASLQIAIERPAESFTISLGRPGSIVTADGYRSGRGRRYEPILVRELRKVPDIMVWSADLRRIVLCSNISGGDGPLAGLADTMHHTIYLDIATECQPGAIDHELFHLYDAMEGSGDEDHEWGALGREDSSVAASQRARNADPPHHGFISEYGMKGAKEDKAEMFAFMMTSYPDVVTLAAVDLVLSAKESLLRRRLASIGIQETFWGDLPATARILASPDGKDSRYR